MRVNFFNQHTRRPMLSCDLDALPNGDDRVLIGDRTYLVHRRDFEFGTESSRSGFVVTIYLAEIK